MIVRLLDEDVRLLDRYRNKMERTKFAHEIITYGIRHKNSIILEIVDEKHIGRPKKAVPVKWAMC